MRKSQSIYFLLLIGAIACSEQRAGDPVETGQTEQRAQFADDTVINLVDPGRGPSLMVTASAHPVTVQVFYVGTKTTDTATDPGAVSLADTLELAADQTARHEIDFRDPAFDGGYGAILLDSTGDTATDVFQTFVQYGGSMFSTGGSVFTGASYRVPYWKGTKKVVLAVTNESGFSFDIQFSRVGSADTKTVNLPVLSTYRFDSGEAAWSLGDMGSIQVLTASGGVVALSGYLDRTPHAIRITPVKAASYL